LPNSSTMACSFTCTTNRRSTRRQRWRQA
jgi:hypothetical protein